MIPSAATAAWLVTTSKANRPEIVRGMLIAMDLRSELKDCPDKSGWLASKLPRMRRESPVRSTAERWSIAWVAEAGRSAAAGGGALEFGSGGESEDFRHIPRSIRETACERAA